MAPLLACERSDGPSDTGAREARASRRNRLDSLVLDSLPPPPAAASVAASPPSYGYAAGDIYPQGSREKRLCEAASHPDWWYLGLLLVLDADAIVEATNSGYKYMTPGPGDERVWGTSVRYLGPGAIGLTWGATVGGAWLALPKCSPHWVGEPPREGAVRARWPVALTLALLAGATAPFVNAIAIGGVPTSWSTEERAGHLITAGIAGFAGALVPYLLPPRTLAAARELDRLRLGTDGRGFFLGYAASF